MTVDPIIFGATSALIGLLITVLGALINRTLGRMERDVADLVGVNERQNDKLDELSKGMAKDFRAVWDAVFALRTEVAVARENQTRMERDLNGIAQKFAAQIEALRPR